MLAALLILIVLAVLLLLAVGIAAETRHITVGAVLVGWRSNALYFGERFRGVVNQHPIKALGVAETVFWIGMLIPLIDNIRDPRFSFTARWVWFLAIAPHEIGHIVCIPFGRMIMIAGGSVWQILFWLLLGVYVFLRKRQVGVALLFWLIVAHSFINLSVYIRDASDRNLPLLGGMGKDHHDWYNLLHPLGLLDYDSFLADAAIVTGVLIALLVVFFGVLTTWFMPRPKLGRRF